MGQIPHQSMGQKMAANTQQTMKCDGNHVNTEDRNRERDKVTFGVNKGKKFLMEGVIAPKLDRTLPSPFGMQDSPTKDTLHLEMELCTHF